MRGKVIRHRFRRLLERTARKKRKTIAETSKPVVINAVYDAQVVLVHDDQDWSDFIDPGKSRNFIRKCFGHHSA